MAELSSTFNPGNVRICSQELALNVLEKLSKLYSLEEEMKQKSFEEDVDLLLAGTEDESMAVFVYNHNFLNLLNLALPDINSPNMLKKFIGILTNLCVRVEIKAALLNYKTILDLIMVYVKCEDLGVVLNTLRLINTCLLPASEHQLIIWMQLFKTSEYANVLNNILQNSTNKDILLTAIDNLNIICSYCSENLTKAMFFTNFVKVDTVKSMFDALNIIAIPEEGYNERQNFEKTSVLCLQMLQTFVSFDIARELFVNYVEVLKIIDVILGHYEENILTCNSSDVNFVKIMSSIHYIVMSLDLGYQNDQCFNRCYNIWKVLQNHLHINKETTYEPINMTIKRNFLKKMREPVAHLMCQYVVKCDDDDIRSQIINTLEKDLNDMIDVVNDGDLLTQVIVAIVKCDNEKKKFVIIEKIEN